MHPCEKVLGNTSPFLLNIFNSLKIDGIDVSNYELDHICYRFDTTERYLELKKMISEFWKILTETQIWWREISTYKLDDPIIYDNRKIWCIELPSPKKNSHYPEWYEHVEFVIDTSFEEFMKLYKNIEFGTKAMSKEINPDITRKYGWCSVKFHHATLEYVIKYLQK